MAPEGYVSEIQRGCLGDGPGIRTTVFLQGCSLRCPWCHNPETRPFAAGRKRTVEEVMRVVRRDLFYYRESGGGLTLSGGEPMAQAEFAEALLAAAKAEGIHTAIETSGVHSLASLRTVCDLFLFDVKAARKHYPEWIGVPWETVEAHLRELAGAPVRLRVPLVAGWNFEEGLLRQLQTLANLPGVEGVDLLPYHDLGRGKARLAGLPEAPWHTMSAPPPEELKRWQAEISIG